MRDRDYIEKRITKIKKEYRKIEIYKWSLRGIVLALFAVFVYLITVIFTIIDFSQVILSVIFILPFLFSVVYSIKKTIPEKKIMKKADKKFGLEERLITYINYKNNFSENPFLKPLEKQLADIMKRIPREAIFKLEWNPEIQLIGLLLAAIIFTTSWFNIGDVEMSNKIVDENIINEGNKIKEETNIEKVELLDPLASAKDEDKDSDVNSGDLEDREKLQNSNSNQELDRKMKEETGENNEEKDMEDLKERLDKIGKDKNKTQNQTEMDGIEGEKQEDGDKSYLWNDNKNRDQINRNEDNVFKKGEEENEGKSKSGDVPGPSGKGGDNTVNSQEKGHNIMDGQKNREGENELKNGQQGKGDKSGDSEKTGGNPGEQESEIKYGNDFAKLDEKGKTAKLKSQISNESYLKTFLEENYTPQNIAASDDLLDSYLQHRSFLLDTLREENIPSYYKEMVRDYFTIIKD